MAMNVHIKKAFGTRNKRPALYAALRRLGPCAVQVVVLSIILSKQSVSLLAVQKFP